MTSARLTDKKRRDLEQYYKYLCSKKIEKEVQRELIARNTAAQKIADDLGYETVKLEVAKINKRIKNYEKHISSAKKARDLCLEVLRSKGVGVTPECEIVPRSFTDDAYEKLCEMVGDQRNEYDPPAARKLRQELDARWHQTVLCETLAEARELLQIDALIEEVEG